jgi:ParB-like chromosome segregation protein Spo0J
MNPADPVRAAFEDRTRVLPLEKILPIRQIKPGDHVFGKYRSILSSIREIGIVEPLVVHPQRGEKGVFLLLDGHMRLKALQELNRTEAPCLIATEDDAFTYNDKISRIAPIQEHRMIMKAIAQGVTPEQIARALDVDADKIRRGMNLLDGVHPDAIEILKDKPITPTALRLYKKVKPLRQLDFAQLMVATNNYTNSYAQALLLGTPADMLVRPEQPKAIQGLKAEDVAQMEKEMETLERDFKVYQNSYGENALTLNVVQRYVKRLIENTQIKRFLGKRYPEIQEELVDLAGMELL